MGGKCKSMGHQAHQSTWGCDMEEGRLTATGRDAAAERRSWWTLTLPAAWRHLGTSWYRFTWYWMAEMNNSLTLGQDFWILFWSIKEQMKQSGKRLMWREYTEIHHNNQLLHNQLCSTILTEINWHLGIHKSAQIWAHLSSNLTGAMYSCRIPSEYQGKVSVGGQAAREKTELLMKLRGLGGYPGGEESKAGSCREIKIWELDTKVCGRDGGWWVFPRENLSQNTKQINKKDYNRKDCSFWGI